MKTKILDNPFCISWRQHCGVVEIEVYDEDKANKLFDNITKVKDRNASHISLSKGDELLKLA